MSVISLDEARKRLESISASKSQSPQNTPLDETGLTLTEQEIEAMLAVFAVMVRARTAPFTTKSDFARQYATEVALAASEGMISTRLNENTHTNTWMVTAEGLEWTENFNDFLSSRH